MSRIRHDNRQMHDKSRGMIRERSRDRFMEEKKDMEHELAHHRESIIKLMNEHYDVIDTRRQRGNYIVKFQHPDSHRMERLVFHYEPNYRELEPLLRH